MGILRILHFDSRLQVYDLSFWTLNWSTKWIILLCNDTALLPFLPFSLSCCVMTVVFHWYDWRDQRKEAIFSISCLAGWLKINFFFPMICFQIALTSCESPVCRKWSVGAFSLYGFVFSHPFEMKFHLFCWLQGNTGCFRASFSFFLIGPWGKMSFSNLLVNWQIFQKPLLSLRE